MTAPDKRLRFAGGCGPHHWRSGRKAQKGWPKGKAEGKGKDDAKRNGQGERARRVDRD